MEENSKITGKNNTKQVDIRWICYTALGVALFVALSYAVQIPIFENYYLCLGYIAMVVYLYKFGLASGTIVGTLGVFLYCILISGLRGMPGWIVGNIIIAVNLGVMMLATKEMNTWTWIAINSAMMVIATIFGILVMKSLTEAILYSQPMLVRVGKNVYATIADAISMEIGIVMCRFVDFKLPEKGS